MDKFQHKVFDVLYSGLYPISSLNEIEMFIRGKKRLMDMFSLLELYANQGYKEFQFWFLRTLDQDYCWTVIGFWNILKEKFPETMKKYLDFKDMYEYLFIEDK